MIGVESAASGGATVVVNSTVLGTVSFDRARLVKVEPVKSVKLSVAKPIQQAVNTQKKPVSPSSPPLMLKAVTPEPILSKWDSLKTYWERIANLDAPKSWKGSLHVGLHFSQ